MHLPGFCTVEIHLEVCYNQNMQKTGGNIMKRVIFLLLCLAVVCSLAGCNQQGSIDSPMDDQVKEQTAETIPHADECLAAAQAYLDGGDIDAAVRVLEQAMETSDDPRIAQMLERLAPVPLAVRTEASCNALDADSVEIHNVTVQEMATGKVRYTIDYTAQKSMRISVLAAGLARRTDIRTNGKRQLFSFEVNGEDLKALRQSVDVKFFFDDEKACYLTIYAGWGDAESLRNLNIKPVEVPFTVRSSLSGAKMTIHNMTVQPLDAETYIFVVDYSGTRPGMVLDVGVESPSEGSVTELNNRIMTTSFLVPKKSLEGKQSFCFTGALDAYSEPQYFAEIDLTTFSLPEYPYPDAPEALSAPVQMDYIHNDVRKGLGDLVIYGVTAQPLSSGYVRYVFDFTYPEKVYFSAHSGINGFKSYGAQEIEGGHIQAVSYIPMEDMKQISNLNLGVSNMSGDWWYDVKASTDISSNTFLPITILDTEGEQTPWKKVAVLSAENAELAQGIFPEAVIDTTAALEVDTSCIVPLDVTRKLVTPRATGRVQPYSTWGYEPFPQDADLRGREALAYTLSFTDFVQFPDTMPAGFDPEALLEWGKDPGLNVDVLHKMGYTGKGAVIAYFDQPLQPHDAYDNVDLHLYNKPEDNSYHGPAVLSLLAGKDIGTAPDACVHYFGRHVGERVDITLAEGLMDVVEVNKELPEDEKITMVGISNNPHSNPICEELQAAIDACEEEGIMVWFCGEYNGMSFYPLSDKNDFGNAIKATGRKVPPELVYVPSGSRTTATGMWGDYFYHANDDGLSWTMPYVLGIYAIVTQIDPSLTQQDLREMIVATARQSNGMNIIDPVAFVAAALDGVGRAEDAAALRAAVQETRKYFYAVMDKSRMTGEDLEAVENYLAQISDATVLVVDAAGIHTAQELYTLLQADNIQRGGQVTGIQIFGDPTLVPTFEIRYIADYNGGVDDAGTLCTDYFFGNFRNDAKNLGKDYSVQKHFREKLPVQLEPEWKVARLPLGTGEFAAFLEKYMAFGEESGFRQPEIVNFSNPIFKELDHTDDMGTFLNRMRDEWDILQLPYRLYGNQLGQFPVRNTVQGGFTAEELTLENQQGIAEFIINSHGQWNNVDKCFYENGEEKRESLLNMDTINDVLSANPYYLTLVTCDNGWSMKNNLTTTALRGQSVGVFSFTHVLSNNITDVTADLNSLPESNVYWFYLHYLNALNQGASRSEAFLTAQRRYAQALLADSIGGISVSSGNYQFNLYNLIGYHNFGLIEPSRSWQCVDTLTHTS